MLKVRIGCLLSVLLMSAPLAFAQDKPAMLSGVGTLLQVSAHGESHRTPDVAEMSAGVVTQQADANAAMSESAKRMAAVVAALKHAGVADRDIQTGTVSLNPQYNYQQNQPPTITGYQASNSVNIRLRDIAKTGEVLDALVKQGANQINGPVFSIDKPDAAMDEARTDAIKHAQSHAELYASATGLKVQRIVSISESGDVVQAPHPMMRMAAVAAPSSTPIESGESTLEVNLNVVYALGK